MKAKAMIAGIEERQRALDAMVDRCQELKICAACAASAGLYLAAMTAQQGMGVDEKEFVAMARTIFRDARQQMDVAASLSVN